MSLSNNLKVNSTQTIKSPCNNKKFLYGQILKSPSKFEYMLQAEIKKIRDKERSQ